MGWRACPEWWYVDDVMLKPDPFHITPTMRIFDAFFVVIPNKTLGWTVISDAMSLMWRHWNVKVMWIPMWIQQISEIPHTTLLTLIPNGSFHCHNWSAQRCCYIAWSMPPYASRLDEQEPCDVFIDTHRGHGITGNSRSTARWLISVLHVTKVWWHKMIGCPFQSHNTAFSHGI